MSGPPLHVVQAGTDHGVSILARQVAGAVGAPVADLATAMAASPRPVHVHVTEALFGGPEETARVLVALGERHPMTVTLHDVPQPGNGTAFERRVQAYRAVLGAATGWVVSSEHERTLAEEHLQPGRAGAVVHLPVITAATVPRGAVAPAPTGDPVVGLLGWVYPGKGHAQVIAACAALGRPLVVRALGAVVRGHEPLVEELSDMARAGGLRLEVSGWVGDDDLADALAGVSVPVCAHRSVSASGSLNSWLSGGRRPVVVDGSYAAELDVLRPGTQHRVPLEGLSAAIGRALDDPDLTWLAPDAVLRPDLDDVGAAYLRWWRS